MMLIDGPLEYPRVSFSSLPLQPLEPLAFAPAPFGQILQSIPHAWSLPARGVLQQLSGELEGALLEGEGVIRECLVGALDLLEDLLEFLLCSLVVHHLLRSLPSLVDARGSTVGILDKRLYSASGGVGRWMHVLFFRPSFSHDRIRINLYALTA